MNITSSTIANLISRFVSVLVNIIATAIAYQYLGPEKFGIWSVLGALLIMFTAFGDGGVAQGLIHTVAGIREKKGNKGVSEVFTSAVILCAFLCVSIFCVGVLFLTYVGLDGIISPSSNQILHVSTITAYIILSGMVLNIYANIMMNVRHGLGQIVSISVWNIIGSLLVIPSVHLVSLFDLGMPCVALAILFPPLLVRLVVHGTYIFRDRSLRFRRSNFNEKSSKLVMLNGGAFFVIAISQAISQHSDQVIISSYHGAEAVTSYALLNRIFVLPVFLATSFSNVAWPILGASFARGDYSKIRQYFWPAFATITIVGILISVLLMVCLDPILKIWLDEIPDYDPILAYGFMAYSILVIPVSALLLIVISAELRKIQLFSSIAMALFNVILTLTLVPKMEAAGAIIATSIAYFVCLFFPCTIAVWKILYK